MNRPRFEFDSAKGRANRAKHGVDFVEAQRLWSGVHVVLPAKRIKGENRGLILGRLGHRVYAAIFTMRGELVRLISCHRADRRLERVFERCLHEEKA